MKRKVTKLTRERAFATIKIVAKAMLSGEVALTYSELAKRLDMPNATGQGLGPILNEAAWMCKEHKLPDVTTVIVTKESFDQGKPRPSDQSFNEEGYWSISGVSRHEVPEHQQKVRDFDWNSVRSLGLG